eukprot:scaffold16793_cov149-Isochrysis_galbana.AAC.3
MFRSRDGVDNGARSGRGEHQDRPFGQHVGPARNRQGEPGRDEHHRRQRASGPVLRRDPRGECAPGGAANEHHSPAEQPAQSEGDGRVAKQNAACRRVAERVPAPVRRGQAVASQPEPHQVCAQQTGNLRVDRVDLLRRRGPAVKKYNRRLRRCVTRGGPLHIRPHTPL